MISDLSIVLLIAGFSIQKLLGEIESNKEKVDECQKYAKAYIDTVKVRTARFLSHFSAIRILAA